MAGSQVSAGSLAPDDDDECHHRKTADPVTKGRVREGGSGEGERERERERERETSVRKHTFCIFLSCLSAHLQHLVWGGLNAGRHVGWAERSLLHVHEIVGGILVQHNLAHWDQWEVSMGPDLWV